MKNRTHKNSVNKTLRSGVCNDGHNALTRHSYAHLAKFKYHTVEVLTSKSHLDKRLFLNMVYIEKNKHVTVNLHSDVDNLNREIYIYIYK